MTGIGARPPQFVVDSIQISIRCFPFSGAVQPSAQDLRMSGRDRRISPSQILLGCAPDLKEPAITAELTALGQ